LTEILDAMTRPDVNGTPALPKRVGPKGLLPSTWLERTLKLEYVDGFGVGQETPRARCGAGEYRRTTKDGDGVGQPDHAKRYGWSAS
jgi:hypothetical protein